MIMNGINVNLIEVLKDANIEVMKNHPNAFFYEADCVLVSTDDGLIGPDIDLANTKLIWGTLEGKTIIVTFKGEGDKFCSVVEIVDEPWLEDRPFTPYIPMTIADAITMLNTANFCVETPNLTLRFALNPTTTEPQYIFTLDRGLWATVGVYSGEVKILKM